jgi:hypothetical protein
MSVTAEKKQELIKPFENEALKNVPFERAHEAKLKFQSNLVNF